MPDDLAVALREAFRGEVRTRLPRLELLSRTAGPRNADVLAEALRDAHSLAGSAVVVGELAAARSARSLEAALDHCRQSPSEPLAASVSAEVDRLAVLLAPWLGP